MFTPLSTSFVVAPLMVVVSDQLPLPLTTWVPPPETLKPSLPVPPPSWRLPSKVFVPETAASSQRVVLLPLAIVPLPARPVVERSKAPMVSVPSATVRSPTALPRAPLIAVGLRVSVPGPAFVKPSVPLTEVPVMPPTVSVPLDTVTVRVPEPPSVTRPLPMVRLSGPANATSPVHDCVTLLESVTAAPLVLPSVPPAIVTTPEPRAEALLTLSVPALSVVPPA